MLGVVGLCQEGLGSCGGKNQIHRKVGGMRVDKGVAQALKRCSLFENLSLTKTQQIANSGKEHRVRKGTFFFRKGDHPAKLYVLIQGRVDLFLHARGERLVLYRTLMPSDHFGDIALFGSSPHIFSAQARDDCLSIAWDVEAMARAITDYPVIARNSLSAIRKEATKLQKRRRSLGQVRPRPPASKRGSRRVR
jgi:CRP-like cAMP-binding protein